MLDKVVNDDVSLLGAGDVCRTIVVMEICTKCDQI